GDRCRVLTAPDGDTWRRADHLLEDVDPRRAYEPGEPVAADDGTCLVAAHDEGARAADHPEGLPVELRADGSVLRLQAGVEVAPIADAVLAAARECGQLLLAEHASLPDLAPFAERLLSPKEEVAAQVRALQADGAVVLVVADTDLDALHAADV